MLGCASQSGARMTLILSNDDVEKLLTMPECIDVMEEAYIELAEGRGISRTRSDCFAPTTRPDALYSLKSMDGVVPKLGVGAVRINSDIITWPKRGNNMRREKVPAAPNNRYVGLVLLFSVETGEPLAILPDGVMQRIRVGRQRSRYQISRPQKREDRRHPRLRVAGRCAAHGGLRRSRRRDDPLLQPEPGKSRHVRRHHERPARRQGRSRRRAGSSDQGR